MQLAGLTAAVPMASREAQRVPGTWSDLQASTNLGILLGSYRMMLRTRSFSRKGVGKGVEGELQSTAHGTVRFGLFYR